MKLFRYGIGLVFIMGLTSFATAWAGPLHEAIEANDLDRVRELISQGASVDSKNEDGRSALYLAALEGHLPVVELLVGNGADVDTVSLTADGDSWTPLIIAAYLGHQDIVDFLVSHNANIDAKDNHGFTAISWAMKEGYIDIVRILISRGANVNVPAVSEEGHKIPALILGVPYPHHYSDDYVRGDIIELLIRHGADVNVKNKFGTTPLHYAVISRQVPIAKLLIEHGADVNATSRLIVAPKGAYLGKVRMTPLHNAVLHTSLEMVKLLVEHGASLHVESTVVIISREMRFQLFYEQTPLDYAELQAEYSDNPIRRKKCERIAEFLRSQL